MKYSTFFIFLVLFASIVNCDIEDSNRGVNGGKADKNNVAIDEGNMINIAPTRAPPCPNGKVWVPKRKRCQPISSSG